MTSEKVRKLNILSRQLTENLMNAASCAREISEIAHMPASDGGGISSSDDNSQVRAKSQISHRPLLDEATLSVIWRGKTVHLGHTKGYWILTRLARRANTYVTHLDLLQEIWDDEFADTVLLRAGVQRLRAKLRRAGMADLADAITGHHGRYMLDLSAAPRYTKVTRMSHQK